MGMDGDCAAPGCTNEATVSDFLTVGVLSEAGAVGENHLPPPRAARPINRGHSCPHGQLHAVGRVQDGNFGFVVDSPAPAVGGPAPPAAATYRFSLWGDFLPSSAQQGMSWPAHARK